METLALANPEDFANFNRVEVELDATQPEVWPYESCALLERPAAELNLYGIDHALNILDLDCATDCGGEASSADTLYSGHNTGYGYASPSVSEPYYYRTR